MFKTKRILWVGLSIFLFTAAAAWATEKTETLWQTDFAAAQAQALKEKKMLLLDFTGSDWCGWCKKLKSEVFGQELFIKEAPKNFILVELDFPQKSQLEEKLAQQNQALSKAYGISGFPSIILTDAAGVEFARTGYQAGGPQAYLDHLQLFVENFQKFSALEAEAAKLEGLARAEKLDQAISLLVDNGSKRSNDKLADEIIAIDKDGKAGLRAKYELPRKLNAIETQLNQDKDFDKAVAALDKLAPEAVAVPSLQQQVYLFQAGILIKGKGDKEAGVKKLELAYNAAPETKTGQQLIKFIDRMKKEGENPAPQPARAAEGNQPAVESNK
ncbi:MAG: thioredoxin family protein [Deltaproteobacteria bacterium]|nr:thioredoxin family protein [Deltaproteobacteria bacterium]